LSTRGTEIAHNKFADVNKKNKLISTLVKENYNSLIRPTAAFIIFEEEEGASQAKHTKPKEGRTLLGMPFKF
jgi:hypothetical protein